MDPEGSDVLGVVRLDELKPYFVITVLECTDNDPDSAFGTLRTFLRRLADKRGRALAVRITGEVTTSDELVSGQQDGNTILLRAYDFDHLYGITRERFDRPEWASEDSSVTNLTNELWLALRRDRLVAVRTDDKAGLLRWVNSGTSPYRRIPVDVMSTTFDGNGRALWLQGVHRRRVTKPDGKTLYGLRLQEAIDALVDSTFAMSAMTVDVVPDDTTAILRGSLTVSPSKSRIALKAMPSFRAFLAATAETLVMLDKSLTNDSQGDMPFPDLAVPEPDLSRVHGAYDIRIADPYEVAGLPGSDEDDVERASLLREALLDVRGAPDSADVFIDVGLDGSIAGHLRLRPVNISDGYQLDVRFTGKQTAEAIAREIRDTIGTGDLINVYYETGHTFTGTQIVRQKLSSSPFPNYEFKDFSRHQITSEKPNIKGTQGIHDRIGKNGDASLFAWVANNYITDWLVCDDGPGEVADFLHLADNGTLTAIHVKAAHSKSNGRRIAVTPFEQVVSQAEKSIRQLSYDNLIDHLTTRSIGHPACWYDGNRLSGRHKYNEFVDQLRIRKASDKTHVVVVQPHLLKSAYDGARAAWDKGKPTTDSYSLALLDTLLLGTRHTVTAVWDDLTVIGCE